MALVGPVLIVNAKRDAVGIAEIEFGQVAVQVLLAAVLIDALHAALEDREVTFDRVRGDFAARRIPSRWCLTARGWRIRCRVSYQAPHRSSGGFAADVPRTIGTMSPMVAPSTWKLRAEPPRSTSVRTMFLCAEPPRLRAWPCQAADVGFVHFDDLAAAAHRAQAANAHRFTDTVRHEPRRLVGDLQGPVELMGGNALLAGDVIRWNRLQPLVQGDLGLLKHGADRYRELLPALLRVAFP